VGCSGEFCRDDVESCDNSVGAVSWAVGVGSCCS
jgi:hypothetical protein